MPKLESKAIHRELEQGILRPVYWLYGQEKLKARELLHRIKTAALGEQSKGVWGWGEELFDGDQTDGASVTDAAGSLVFGGGLRFILVREAHLLKNPEGLTPLFGPAGKKSEMNFVCVFLAKDLDGRKKFTKILLDKAAVIPCEEIPEAQREAWVQYLAKRRGLNLDQAVVMTLCTLDPWSLEMIEQELEKLAVAGSDEILSGSSQKGGSEAFIEAFLSRDLNAALSQVSFFAEETHLSLPLLGLLGWNVRQLATVVLDREKGTRNAKLNPYRSEQFHKWSLKWKLYEILELQKEISELDFSLKQTPLLPLGLWTGLVIHFCKN